MSKYNSKSGQEKAYAFHGATATLNDVAKWYNEQLGLSTVTNLKSRDDVIKLVTDTMGKVRPDCELGFIKSYRDKNPDKTLYLKWHEKDNIFTNEKAGSEGVMKFDVKDMWDIKKTLFGNLKNPEAPSNSKWNVKGPSLRSHIEAPRQTAIDDVRTTYGRLRRHVRDLVLKQCSIPVDNSEKKKIEKANSHVGSLFNILEEIKDTKTIEILNEHMPKKYMNKVS